MVEPKHGRVPAPSYAFTSEESGSNVIMDRSNPASWVERLASHTAGDAMRKAAREVHDQVPPLAKRRTKYPPPSTVKYATFSRRKTIGMRAVGGLPAIAAVSQLVTTTVPAQYGNFVVTSKQSVAPTKKKYVAAVKEYIFEKREFISADVRNICRS